MNIAISGNILSGKTTLAKAISEHYGYTFIPQKRSELDFLNDFFANIPRYFLPTQSSFILNKSIEVNESSKHSSNIVMDRSLYEDIHIFAQLWKDNYNIDSREKKLYDDLAEYILSKTMDVDIYIVCKCNLSTLNRRFQNRLRRSFENQYPKDYIEQLNCLYDNLSFPKCSMVIEIDTDKIDLRCKHSIELIVNEINNIIDISKTGHNKDEYVSQYDWCKVISFGDKHLFHIEYGMPSIYLAAPFTEFATVIRTENSATTDTEKTREYNILPQQYRDFLCECASLIKSGNKCRVIIPHEQENNWGETYKTGEQIVSSMFSNTVNCDMLVAILSNSIGVHMEITSAILSKKPVLIIIVEELTSGFYAKGLSSAKNVHVASVKSLQDVKEYLNSVNAIRFINASLNYREGE